MRNNTVRGSVVGIALVVFLIATPGAALAHGVPGAPVTVPDFARAGVVHMLTGHDHLLFVAGIVLFAGQAGRAAKLISAFAVGHSTTLIVGTLGGWLIDPNAVDVLIALSVVFVGLAGLVGWPGGWRSFAAAVFGFGLAHGLGLATRLQAIGLPRGGELSRVIAFNIGIEIGQLLAVAAMVLLGKAIKRYVTWPNATRYANLALVTIGAVLTAVLAVVAVTAPTE